MYLPHLQNALVPKNKILDYLINLSHWVGGSKAIFFRNFGFNENNVNKFENSLLNIVRSNEVLKITQNAFGTKYIIDGIFITPDGRNPEITTVWFIENQTEIPKLVTAYPK